MACHLLVLLLVVPVALAGKTIEKDGVFYFEKEDFDQVLGKKAFAVYFHSPWSSASSNVLHEFKLTADVLHAEGTDLSFGVVDASKDDFNPFRFGVQDGPDLRIFHDAKPYTYEGNFTRVDLVEQLRPHGQPDWTPPQVTRRVIELGSIAEFEAHIKKERLTLVDMYAPWCNHCQQLEPVLDAVADELNKLSPPVTVAKIDVSQHNELFSRYKMKGYPYVFLFKNGKPKLFELAKNVQGLVNFVKSNAAVASTEVPAVRGSAYAFSDSKKTPAVVGFFPSRSAFEFQVFTELAEQIGEDKTIAFGYVIGSKALDVAREDFGVTNEDYGIVLVRDRRLPVKRAEKRFSIFEEDPIETDSVKEFISNNRRSLVGYATADTYWKLYKKLSPVVLTFMDVDWDPDTRDAMTYRLNLVAQVAEAFPDMHFVAIDHSDMHELRTRVGLGENDNDMTAAVFVNASQRYPLDGECSVETLTAHLQSYNAGTLKAHVKSQRVPSPNNGPVKTLVRSTFDEVMADTSIDIAVLFTAPWSKDSQKFLPVFKKAHSILAAESVVFYKYDCVANDVPQGLDTTTYPALYVFPADRDSSTSPKRYEGPRNSKKVAEYLRDVAISLEEQADEDASDEASSASHEEL